MDDKVWGEPDDGSGDAGWMDSVDMSDALFDVINERARQVSVEGYTTEQDDGYEMAELQNAGAFYALDPLYRAFLENAGVQIWPFRQPPKPKDLRRDLIRAAALLIAEIERLDRASVTAVPA